MAKVKMDAEMKAFAADVLGSIQQMKRGEQAKIHTPADIANYKARGRPAGSTQATVKSPTTLRLDADALARWRATGKGWQTRAADLLAAYAPK